MAKRKRYSTAPVHDIDLSTVPIPSPLYSDICPSPLKRRASQRTRARQRLAPVSTNPDENPEVLDGPEALRASPDAGERDERMALEKVGSVAGTQVKEKDDEVPSLLNGDDSSSSLSEISEGMPPLRRKPAVARAKKPTEVQTVKATTRAKEHNIIPAAKVKTEVMKEPLFLDPEAEGDEEADEEEIQAALSRPPPVNSNYLPLPWKGRLGYACLCTYLRFSNPPVFSSRTCRIASILENRHPLKDPDQPPHATKNRPDRDQPASIARGQAYVESIGLANAADIVKMLRWNDRYGIKFLRLSSEMFPFASHEEYGYKLAPFASEVLAEAGRVAAELGHRLTTHPGQFTQLGSPRQQVIDNAVRDLEYHTELLSLLKLPAQQNRDAVMILHLGGVFGDKAATLDRFRENYARLPQGTKDRLVLENDDVSWSVHDLLPLCEELNIPMVLDFHHHNIIFDPEQAREGTKDIMDVYPRILATWKRKNITPKMHYSEPTPAAITGRQRRKHSPRVATLPPCPPDMDLMIEAKDKEQAVFELMRTFKLPGYDTFNDMIPHVRKDDNKPVKLPKKKTPRKTAKKVKDDKDELEAAEEPVDAEEDPVQAVIPDLQVGMGGPEGRVYWPPTMEDWLRPVKKVIKKKDPEDSQRLTPAKKRMAATKNAQSAIKLEGDMEKNASITSSDGHPMSSKGSTSVAKGNSQKASYNRKAIKSVPTTSTSDTDASKNISEFEGHEIMPLKATKITPARKSARAKKVNYVEGDE